MKEPSKIERVNPNSDPDISASTIVVVKRPKRSVKIAQIPIKPIVIKIPIVLTVN